MLINFNNEVTILHLIKHLRHGNSIYKIFNCVTWNTNFECLHLIGLKNTTHFECLHLIGLNNTTQVNKNNICLEGFQLDPSYIILKVKFKTIVKQIPMNFQCPFHKGNGYFRPYYFSTSVFFDHIKLK